MLTIRVLLLGPELVGKTSLAVCLTTQAFPRDSLPTVFDSFRGQVRVDGRPVLLTVWDTAPRDEHRLSVRRFYYPLADVFVFCFSIGDPASFECLWADWYMEVRRLRPTAPVLLVGTKHDLRHSMAPTQLQAAPVTYQQGAGLARRMQAAAYVECSALLRDGVGHVFEEAARAALRAGHAEPARTCVLT
ncbi:rho-related GTP-binding protein RhoG-like [Narcine bancroftii]|uniref:rho-related GTP-binding protein RhoG-like n=1 Tax=Narcine bancroftii TaxID=1343680 RepID=UPI00383179EF